MELEKKFQVEGFGDVFLKKFTFADKCILKGKIVNITIDKNTGAEKTTIDSGAIFFWTTALSIKSIPSHPKFFEYELDMKEKIISDATISDYMEAIMAEALDYNKLNTQQVGKKNSPSSEEETKRPEDKPVH